jgi:hypothetical protein
VGTKFANIQVCDDDTLAVEKALNDFVKNKKSKSENGLGKMFPFISDALVSDINTYYIGNVSSGWVTILNSTFGWESIAETALEFSQYYKGSILNIGYFDDDVFCLDLVNDGVVLTTHISARAAYNYGIEPVLGSAETLVNTLQLQVSAKDLVNILVKDNLAEKVSELENILGATLWLKADWLHDYDNDLIDKFKPIF